ncbi:MAG TPA: carboxypeptidase-like regulatory domain-containing protein, partial [Blastocatellia bacterium]|nr:carboxypeptidase-like regulatory domain-containing protein [Blastocatellia bacterium]
MSGSVADSAGQAIANVKITVTNDEIGLRRETKTNEDGYFSVPFLPSGHYWMTAEAPGFAVLRVTGMNCQAGINSAVTITLHPKGAQEYIEVRAGSNGVNSTDATIKYSIP